MTLLEARDIGKSYGPRSLWQRGERRTVLTDVNLAVAPEECVGLIGESGSGKSTLGRLMLGLEAPDSGQILFRGRPLTGPGAATMREFRRAVQVVFQDSIGAVDPRHSIARIVAEPLRHLTRLGSVERKARVTEVLEAVEIDPAEADKLPGQVSGGQLQRVCIARALACRPDLILLDEAVSNLDLTLQIQVLDLLARLREAHGMAFLFVTHDLRLVRRFCDRVAVMADGRIVEQKSVPAGPFAFTHPAGRSLEAAILPARPGRTAA